MPPTNNAPTAALMTAYPLAIGPLEQPTKLQGTWYVAYGGRTIGTGTKEQPTGSHAYLMLAKDGDKNSPHRLQCLMDLSDLEAAAAAKGTRFKNPTVCRATRRNEEDTGWVPLEPTMKDVPDGQGGTKTVVYWVAYILDADAVEVSQAPLKKAGDMLRHATAISEAVA